MVFGKELFQNVSTIIAPYATMISEAGEFIITEVGKTISHFVGEKFNQIFQLVSKPFRPYYPADTDYAVRKPEEEVRIGIVSIYRWGVPAQTSTTTYFRISEIIDGDPFEKKLPILPGAQRKYRFAINYADDLDLGQNSKWRIFSEGTTFATFTLPPANTNGSLHKGKPYLTEPFALPSAPWHLELRLPVDDRRIRIFQIELIAMTK